MVFVIRCVYYELCNINRFEIMTETEPLLKRMKYSHKLYLLCNKCTNSITDNGIIPKEHYHSLIELRTSLVQIGEFVLGSIGITSWVIATAAAVSAIEPSMRL